MGYRSEVMADGPKVYFRLGETSGRLAYDYSGHGNHGEIRGYMGNAFGSPRSDPETQGRSLLGDSEGSYRLWHSETEQYFDDDGTIYHERYTTGSIITDTEHRYGPKGEYGRRDIGSDDPYSAELLFTLDKDDREDAPERRRFLTTVGPDGYFGASAPTYQIFRPAGSNRLMIWLYGLYEPGIEAEIHPGLQVGPTYHLVITATITSFIPGNYRSVWRVYLNGVLRWTSPDVRHSLRADINVGSGGMTSVIAGDREILGGLPKVEGGWLGLIDEFAAYNKALSPQRIQAHYQASLQKQPPEALVFTELPALGADLDAYLNPQGTLQATLPAPVFEMGGVGSHIHMGTELQPLGFAGRLLTSAPPEQPARIGHTGLQVLTKHVPAGRIGHLATQALVRHHARSQMSHVGVQALIRHGNPAHVDLALPAVTVDFTTEVEVTVDATGMLAGEGTLEALVQTVIPGQEIVEVVGSLTGVGTVEAVAVETEEATEPGPSYAATVLADAPTAYYRMGGTELVDSSGNEHHGSYVQTVGQGASLLAGGDTDVSLDLPARAAGHALVPYWTWMNTDYATWEAWFHVTDDTFLMRILGRGSSFGLECGGGYLTFDWLYYAAGVKHKQIQIEAAYEVNRTYHVAVTYSAQEVVIYLDGEVIASEPSPGPLRYSATPPSPNLAIGSTGATSSARLFRGRIDEVAIYDRPLSSRRIRTHHAVGAGLPLPEFEPEIITVTGELSSEGTLTALPQEPEEPEEPGEPAVAVVIGYLSGEGTVRGYHETNAATVTAEAVLTFPGLSFQARAGHVTGVGQQVQRWRLGDPETGEVWVMPINPNEMGSPFAARNLNLAHGVKHGLHRVRAIDLASSGPATWTFGGVIRSREHHDELARWAQKNRPIVVVDHLGRAFEVLIQSFDPEDRRPTPATPWRMRYAMTCLVIKESA